MNCLGKAAMRRVWARQQRGEFGQGKAARGRVWARQGSKGESLGKAVTWRVWARQKMGEFGQGSNGESLGKAAKGRIWAKQQWGEVASSAYAAAVVTHRQDKKWCFNSTCVFRCVYERQQWGCLLWFTCTCSCRDDTIRAD